MKRQARRGRGETEMDRKQLRIIFIIAVVSGIIMLISAAFLIIRQLVIPDLSYVLLFDLLGTVTLYTGFLGICTLFLYLCGIIAFKNPQRIKPSKVLLFALFGVGVLVFSIWLVRFSSNEVEMERLALNDYKEGNWAVKDLYIEDIYGPSYHSRLTLLETEVGDLFLYWEPFQIYQGRTYRITYLEKTGVVIKMEVLNHGAR